MAAGDFPVVFRPSVSVTSGQADLTQLAAAATPMMIATLNTGAAIDRPDDPFWIANSNQNSHENIRILPVAKMPFVRAYHLISGTNEPTTTLKVKAFGFFPTPNNLLGVSGDKTIVSMGTAADGSNFNDLDHVTLVFNPTEPGVPAWPGMWFPLYSPISEEHELEFDGSAEIDKEDTTDSGIRLKIHHSNVMWRTAGAAYCMFTISQAASGGSFNTGLLGVNFSHT